MEKARRNLRLERVFMNYASYASEKKLQREATNMRLMESGVKLEDPSACYIDESVFIAPGTVILPNTTISGATVIGENCVIGPNTVITDCRIRNGCTIMCSYLMGANIGNEVSVGPFSYLRPGTVLSDRVKIGDFVEIKNATIGEGTKASHLTYIGDCDVGRFCNFGCGTVVVNYNGKEKFRSRIGDNAFIGCNTNLVSPVEVGNRGYTAAGSTVTNDVPEGALAIARAQQKNIVGWVDRKGYLNK